MTELDREARRLLELTREARTPSAEDKLRVEQLLSQSLRVALLSGAAGAGTAAVARPGLAALAAKWTVIVAVPALIVAGASTLQHREPAAPPPEPPAKSVAPAVPQAAEPPVEQTRELTGPAEAKQEPEPVKPAARSRSTRERVAPAQPSDSLNEELDLLHEAQAAWRRGDAGQALSVLSQHRKRYPRSVLGPEREALRVLSLCAAGRTAEAKEVARRSFPKGQRSPLRASVEQSCVKD